MSTEDEKARIPHPADAIGVAEASARVHASLTGGLYWDALAISMRPELSQIGSEHVAYTLDACVDEGLTDVEDMDPDTPEAREVLARWCDLRAETCAAILRELPIVDGHVRAHRLIACAPADLRPALGAFWTYDLDNWPDPYAPWSPDGRDSPTLVIEAMIPVRAVDWTVSTMARMDWYCGDSEAELRVLPGHPVRIVGCTMLDDPDVPVAIPDARYTT